MKEICYACDDWATSREHCPPKCFFPKNQRKNLITVPACSKHNNRKSNDDEWVRLIIASMAGEEKLLPTIMDSLKRPTKTGNPSVIQNHALDMLNQIVPNHLKNTHDLPDDIQYGKYELSPEKADILRKHLELMARGIMYHENGVNCKNSLFNIQSDKLPPAMCRKETKYILDLISYADSNNLLLGNTDEKGDNKNIFSYKINILDLMSIIQLKFYQKVVINIVFYPYPNTFRNRIIAENFLMHLIEFKNK